MMPRRKQPPSLRSSCLRVLAELTVNSCKKSDGKQEEVIRLYVQDIPIIFANEYVNEVLRLCASRGNHFDITSAFHPKCTQISKDGVGKYFNSSDHILGGLHIMSDLINIEPAMALLDPNWEFSQAECPDIIPFPEMANLRSINLMFNSEPHLLAKVIENCPQLESIKLDGSSLCGVMESTLLLLSNCKHLKRICVDSMTPKVAIHLLDHLPNLEVLQMNSKCILKVLPLCKHAYQLKDFVIRLKVHEADSVQKVVTNFPHLEQLSLKMFVNAEVNMISELSNLKSLTISYNGESSNLLFLMDKCMFGLHELHLDNVTGLDSLFRQNMNVSYPNLKSLTLTECRIINVAGIREIFPNLKSLKLLDGEYMSLSLPYKMTLAGSEALEHLEMTNVPEQQVRYLIPFCSKLKNLKVHNRYFQSCVYELLCDSNLKELRTLKVDDNSMNREVIPIILHSCGEYLEMVHLESSQLILTQDNVRELSIQLQPYDMYFWINNS